MRMPRCPECNGRGGWEDAKQPKGWKDCPRCDGAGTLDEETEDGGDNE